MKIYTKTGDQGETGLFGGGRVRKDDARVEAYGAVDELNAFLGFARAAGLSPENDARAQRAQNELFTVGSTLATPAGTKAEGHIPRIDEAWARGMEESIDRIDGQVPKLTQFVLPGGVAGAAALHLARSVCRRAERRVSALAAREPIPASVLIYLNRLSDLLFMMARLENQVAGHPETAWAQPK
jgi:cob(I)alamin adenosyltransferase